MSAMGRKWTLEAAATACAIVASNPPPHQDEHSGHGDHKGRAHQGAGEGRGLARVPVDNRRSGELQQDHQSSASRDSPADD